MSYHISRLLCYQIRDGDSIPAIHGPGASPGSGALIAVYDTDLGKQHECSAKLHVYRPDGALGRFGSNGGLFARVNIDLCVLLVEPLHQS